MVTDASNRCQHHQGTGMIGHIGGRDPDRMRQTLGIQCDLALDCIFASILSPIRIPKPPDLRISKLPLVGVPNHLAFQNGFQKAVC